MSDDLLSSNIIVFIDGGAILSDGCSSSAFVIGLHRRLPDGNWNWRPMIGKGFHFAIYQSSFAVEMIAIDDAATWLSDFLKTHEASTIRRTESYDLEEADTATIEAESHLV